MLASSFGERHRNIGAGRIDRNTLPRRRAHQIEVCQRDRSQQDLHPNDQIEWLPFLQAYAMLGNLKQVKNISTRINTEPFYQVQVCENFGALAQAGSLLLPEMQSSVDELFCK